MFFKKLLFLFAACVLIFQFSFSQAEDPKPKIPLKDRFFTGGNLGLQFGVPIFINVAPIIGFKITKMASVGVGATYIYVKYPDYYIPNIMQIYGGSVFARHTIWRNIYAHAEYEILNGEWTYGNRYNITSVLVGGGFRQQLFGNSYLNLTLLWNLNNTYDSPYTNPIIRGGVSIGL